MSPGEEPTAMPGAPGVPAARERDEKRTHRQNANSTHYLIFKMHQLRRAIAVIWPLGAAASFTVVVPSTSVSSITVISQCRNSAFSTC